MRLEFALHTVVSKRSIPLLNTKKFLKLGVRKNLTLVRRVLKFVFLDVGTDCFSHIDAGLKIVYFASNKLDHLFGNCNLLQKPRVDVSPLLWLFTHNTDRLGLQTLDSLADFLQELGTRALGGAEVLDLGIKILDKHVKMVGNRLACSLQTRDLDRIDFDGLDLDGLDGLDLDGLDGLSLGLGRFDGLGFGSLDSSSFGLNSLGLDSLGFYSLGLNSLASCGGLSLTVGSSVGHFF